jgi:dienelactone hydrolase
MSSDPADTGLDGPPGSVDTTVTLAGGRPVSGARPRRWARIILAILGVVLLVVVAGAAWWLQPQPVLSVAASGMTSTDEVLFTEEAGWPTWRPADGVIRAGLVFYPGGKVEPAAYARSAQAIAAEGYLVVVPSMPLNLAVLAPDRAAEVFQHYPDVPAWVVAGHSLGGAMAGRFAATHPGAVRGLALWAAYPDGDVSDDDIAVTSVFGSLDQGRSRFDSAETRALLPADARFVVIDGGNHEQMGDYTGQPNDPPATISRDEQQAIARAATVELLRHVSDMPEPSGGP